MKTFLLAILVLSVMGSGKSHAQAFDVDTKVISLGLGIGSALGSFNYSSQIPGLSLQYEQGVWKAGGPGVISLGGYAGYKGFSFKTSSGNFEATSKWNYTIVGLRSAYHYQGLENDALDLYAGIMLGYYILNYSYSDNSGNSNLGGGNFGNTAGFTIYGGARYYLAENLGVFGEIGYGVAYLNIGGVLKF